ncbi:hypothetical protein V2J09_013570 [Rumex salicifolius]
MATEVSRQIKGDEKPGNPITRDFLSGSFAVESKELDLDLHVPVGWEKRLDLKAPFGLQSGKVYIQKCIQQSSSSSNQTQPYSKKGQTLNLFEDTSLKLKTPFPKLPSNPLGNYNNATYQSVHTLDKVKSALDRAYRFPSPTPLYSKKRSSPSNSPPLIDGSDRNQNLVAGACPRCLLYVLISETNPKCPKCNSTIPVNVIASKKPKIDLNISI